MNNRNNVIDFNRIRSGLTFEMPKFHPTNAIDVDLPTIDKDGALVETLFLGPVTRFGLEDFVEEETSPEETSPESQEIERLVSNGKYQQAYDLYLNDVTDETPDDFQEFLAKLIDC